MYFILHTCTYTYIYMVYKKFEHSLILSVKFGVVDVGSGLVKMNYSSAMFIVHNGGHSVFIICKLHAYLRWEFKRDI